MGTHNSVVVLNEFFLALFFVSDDFLIQAFDTDDSQSKILVLYYLKAHKMCFQMMLSFFLLLVC